MADKQEKAEHNPSASKNSYKTHKAMLRNLVKDDRMQPSRRLLAEMLLLYLEGYIEKELLEIAFGSGTARVKWNKGQEGADPQAATRMDLDTSNTIKEAYQDIREMLKGASTDGNITNSTTDSERDTSST